MKKIGILGAGQLGRMLALEGLPLEMRFSFYDTSGAPSVGIEPVIVDTEASLTNPKLAKFLGDHDVVTYEFEHLPLHLVQHIEATHTLYPPAKSIEVCQDRAKEKSLFKQLAIPTPAFCIIESEAELIAAVEELGCPCVVKTTTEGYDGKGQFVIREASQCGEAWNQIGNRSLIVEQFINFSRELSVIAVRSVSGETKVYPIAENAHHEGILRYSTAPAPHLNEENAQQAKLYMKELMEALGHVGVLTLELFETPDGLLANEMAPRVHNSGHWSLTGAACSQFENHLRAITDLPLGDTEARGVTCMVNIISNKGDIESLLKLPYAKVHLYDKEERAGRKLGHVNVHADSYDELKWRVKNVASYLPRSPEFSGYDALNEADV
jgi:5-(carboxyamino)imidazole ribonucleotide synthase